MSAPTQLAYDGRWLGESLDGSIHVAETFSAAHWLAAQHNIDEHAKLSAPTPTPAPHSYVVGTGPLAVIARERHDADPARGDQI